VKTRRILLLWCLFGLGAISPLQAKSVFPCLTWARFFKSSTIVQQASFVTGPTVLHRLLARAKKYPNTIAYRYREINDISKTKSLYKTTQNAASEKDFQKIMSNIEKVAPLRSITQKENLETVFSLAMFLENQGFSGSDTLVMNFFNRPAWPQFMLAANLLKGMSGATPVDHGSFLVNMLKKTDAKVLVIQNEQQLKKMLGENYENLHASVEIIITLEKSFSIAGKKVISFNDAIHEGSQLANQKDIQTYLDKMDAADPALLFSTSGTTGDPKIVVWSQETLLTNTDNILAEWSEISPNPNGRLMSFLPNDHIIETVQNLGLNATTGYTHYFATFPPTFRPGLTADLRFIQVSAGLFVPRLWDAMKTGVQDKVAKAGAKIMQEKQSLKGLRYYKQFKFPTASFLSSQWFKQCKVNILEYFKGMKKSLALTRNKIQMAKGEKMIALFHWSHATAKRIVTEKMNGRPISPIDQIKYKIADQLVLSKVRTKLGLNNAKVVASGSAALDESTLKWFRGLGIDILEGYGQTESGIVLMTRRAEDISGILGYPIGNISIKLNKLPGLGEGKNIGELLIKVDKTTSLGYFNNSAATQSLIDSDGWLHTGDVVEILEGGALKFLDRMGDTVKLSNGQFVNPGVMERKILEKLPELDKILIIGQGRKNLTALIVLKNDIRASINPTLIDGMLIEDPALNKEILNNIKLIIEELNVENTPGISPIKAIKLLSDDFGDEYMTPTMKLKKRKILENSKIQKIIETMY